MTAIPHAAKALTSAFDRLEHAAVSALGAVIGASSDDRDLVRAMADMTTAKHQLKASVAVVRVADEMMAELLRLQARRD